MSRREIVLLVSRAIAILQLIPALMELFISAPQTIYLMLWPILRAQSQFPQTAARVSDLLLNLRWTALGFILVRTVAELIIAWLFWNCGPAIERLLLPSGSSAEEPA